MFIFIHVLIHVLVPLSRFIHVLYYLEFKFFIYMLTYLYVFQPIKKKYIYSCFNKYFFGSQKLKFSNIFMNVALNLNLGFIWFG